MDEYLDLDSKSAVTIFSYVDILRDNPVEELGMVDLENHVSQAIWRLFDNTRGEAANRLGVNEVDLLLTDARVLGVKIDDNEVINPEGFTGRKLEVLLSITMVRRDKFEESQYLCEGGSVRAYLLSKEKNLKNALYVEVHDDVTTIFHITPTTISHFSGFDWGSAKIMKNLEDEFGISTDAAHEVYERYINELVSPHAMRKLDRVFYNAFDELVDGVVSSIKNNLSGGARSLPPIYFRSFFPISNKIHRKRFLIGGKRFSFLSTEDNIDIDKFVSDDVHNLYKELNQLAQRRIKWLMPSS